MFVPPSRHARQHQARDVRARDEQQHADRGPQHPQRRTHAAEDVVHERRDDGGRAPLQTAGVLAIEPRFDGVRLRPRSAAASAGPGGAARRHRTRRPCRGSVLFGGVPVASTGTTGTQNSAPRGKSTPGGMTPTISTGLPSSVIRCADDVRDRAPNRRTQAPWFSTATAGAFGTSSSGRSPRPSSGRTPSVSKKPADTPLNQSARRLAAALEHRAPVVRSHHAARAEQSSRPPSIPADADRSARSPPGRPGRSATRPRGRPARSTGSGRSSTVLTALKIALLAPMASAKVRTAVTA